MRLLIRDESKREAIKRECYLKLPTGHLEKKRIKENNKKSYYGEVA